MFACHAFGVFFVLLGRTWGKKLRSHLSLLWAPALRVRGSWGVRFRKRSVFGESRSLGGEANLFLCRSTCLGIFGEQGRQSRSIGSLGVDVAKHAAETAVLQYGGNRTAAAKKACVTASARVWYLEPKWLR